MNQSVQSVPTELVLDVQESYEPLQADDYACVVDRIEAVESEFGGEVKPQFQWTFRVVRGEHTNREIRGWTSRNSGRQSKLYLWYCSILSIPLTNRIETINLAELYGKNVVVSLDQYLNQAGLVRNKITQLRAPKKPKPPTPAPPVVPTPSPDDPESDARDFDPFDI